MGQQVDAFFCLYALSEVLDKTDGVHRVACRVPQSHPRDLHRQRARAARMDQLSCPQTLRLQGVVNRSEVVTA